MRRWLVARRRVRVVVTRLSEATIDGVAEVGIVAAVDFKSSRKRRRKGREEDKRLS